MYDIHAEPDLSGPSPPGYRGPPLIAVLEGWIDAGLGAGAALAALLGATTTKPVATFDADRLLDHRARRPVMRLVDGVNTELVWPETQLLAGHDAAGRPFLVLCGPEPDHEWRAFSNAVLELANRWGVGVLVGLGAFPAPVPHTRPSRLAATATTPELAREVGYVPGRIDVPAGVQAALERHFAEAGLPAIGLWARVPHYAAAMPYPEASAVLLEGLAQMFGITVDTTELHQAGAAQRQRIDELIANSDEHTAMVRQLEAQADAESGSEAWASGGGGEGGGGRGSARGAAGGALGAFTDLPSGDEIAAELERFLRGES